MKEDKFSDLNPADYWPDAEKMIDSHFKAKKKKRALIWFLSSMLLLGTGMGLYLYQYSSAPKNSPAAQQTEKSITQKTELIKNNSSESNDNKSVPALTQNQISKAPLSNTTKSTSNSFSSKTINSSSSAMPVISDNLSHKPNPTSTDKNEKDFRATSASPIHTTTPGTSETEQYSIQPKELKENSAIQLSEFGPTTDFMHPVKYTFPPLAQNDSLSAVNKNNPEKPKNTFATEWRLDLTAGANLVTKKMYSDQETPSMIRRKNEESEIVSPSLKLSVSRLTKSFEIRAGIGIEIAGEKLNYSPYANKDLIINSSSWHTYYDTIIDTDTNFVYGYVYYSQQIYHRLDSNMVNETDTIKSLQYSQNISDHNSINRLVYIELPVSITWYFTGGKFRTGISAGIAPMLLAGKEGYYLKNDMSGIESFKEIKSFRKLVWSAQAGIDIRYMLTPKCHLLLRPTYSIMLNPTTSSEVKIRQKYNSAGVQAGVSFLLK